MTKYMLADLSVSRPTVLITDTTFNTNEEWLRLFLFTYKSVITGKTEIAAYIFLETETSEHVKVGLETFRSLLLYDEDDVGGNLWTGVDKDFNYIKILV